MECACECACAAPSTGLDERANTSCGDKAQAVEWHSQKMAKGRKQLWLSEGRTTARAGGAVAT
eukprot:4814044-Pleurochrysis_carterae.AAC.1